MAQQQDPVGDAGTEVFHSVEDPHTEEAPHTLQVVQEGAPEFQCVNSNMVRSSSDTQFSTSSGMKVQPVKRHYELLSSL